jgi:hypothetical protein
LQNPMTTPSLRISNEPGRKREDTKRPFIVATYVYASSQGQRTHSARTKRVWDKQTPERYRGQGLVMRNTEPSEEPGEWYVNGLDGTRKLAKVKTM